jgi:TonB family protein
MRLASFFVLSLSLHMVALVYPVSFAERRQTEIIQVMIVPVEREAGGGSGGQGGNGISKRRGNSKPHNAVSPTFDPLGQPKSPVNPEPQGLPAKAIATASDDSVALVSAIANLADTATAAISGPAGNDANDFVNGLGGTGTGSGSGSSGAGFGRGSGTGNGFGSSGTGIALTQARYRDTPRPDYPESARRQGREGRVLLRVLVDDQGRVKQVEIHSSAGSEALDRAATEAIERWRFHPARNGDQPVESWLRIPIEFRLADAKPW